MSIAAMRINYSYLKTKVKPSDLAVDDPYNRMVKSMGIANEKNKVFDDVFLLHHEYQKAVQTSQSEYSIIDHIYRCVIASVAIVQKIKKPTAQVFLQHREYQRAFNIAMQTVEPELVSVNLGLIEPPWQFVNTYEQIDEFLTKEVREGRDNLVTLSLDKSYNLLVCIRHT